MHRPNSPNRPNAGNNGNRNWRDRRENRNATNRPRVNPEGPNAGGNNNHNPQNRNQNRGRGGGNNHHQARGPGGNDRRTANRDHYSTAYFNFRRLTDFSQMNSDEVVAKLAEKKTDFEELMKSTMTPDVLVVTLRVLTNICQANFAEIVTSVLSNACSANFLKSLEAYLTKLAFEGAVDKAKNKLYHEDKDRFWSNLIQFFKKLVELLPTKSRDELTAILQKLTMISMTIEATQGYKIDAQVQEDAANMLEDLEEEIRKIEEKNKVRAAVPNVFEIEEDPPEDFRQLSVIPTVVDLYDQKPFYRACKIKDAYDSVEHYLDVQFRLLREDFVSPLRSGIQEYLHGPNKHRSNELRIYKKVTFAPEVAKNSVGIMAFFGVMKAVNWRHSKRFMFGGLLLLSRDNFNTILFVTVANRDEKQLEKGFILIEPCEGTRITRDMYNDNFVMLESKIYFEPYLAVLNAMQHMNINNFPMTNYLVEADTSTALPRYLAGARVLEYKGYRLPIAEGQLWPPAERLDLDESQYNAFRCAVTQEFAVIQGPPGTGKTFIALEIVGTLLANKEHWKRNGPIVVVCLTNHALDQFLEGILKHTNSIVRVGSRSKSESLKPFTLMERRKVQSHRRNPGVPLMYETKHEVESVMNSLQEKRLAVKHLMTPDAIVPLECLQKHCHDLKLSEMKTNEELVNWLVGFSVINPPADPGQQENLLQMPEENQEEDQNRHMDDELELAYKFKVEDSDKTIFPLKSMDALIMRLHEQILAYRSLRPEDREPLDPSIEWEEDLKTLREQRTSLQRKLAQHPILTQQRYPANNLRWRSYWRWVANSYETAMNKMTELEQTYRRLNLKLNEAKQMVDLAVIREHDVIGLTTTGAAKIHASLCALSAPIVLVEEAAEILEAHVVCSLSKNCQHIILIGDHKQLRPKASVYQLGTKYNLNISLFERMVNIRGNCTQLAHQHRMRPEIANLIRPSIYETLHDHDSVLDYPKVKGLEKNLFFLNHANPETSHNNEESWVNPHETVFLVAFARHLILQGYNPTEITILCTYTGQLFALMKETARYQILRQMRVTTIDNYQGEENRIILLSLVRNNGEGNIGFLKEENRVCVALSRAREGLYVMGNMADLMVKNNIWPKIKKVLEEEEAIGDSLQLRCQIHSDQTIKVKNVSDFQQCPEGGCSKKCGSDLPCGHSCKSICHILDREHEDYKCKEACIKSCPNEHPCLLKCFQGCNPCRVIVERRLRCGHTVQMPCSTDPHEFACYVQVDAILPGCNHPVKKPCHRPVEKCVCPHPCEIRLPCGHTCRHTCHVTQDPDHIEYQCFKDCTKRNVDCEGDHPCKKKCHEECGLCPILVEKKRSCGHHYKKIRCCLNIEAQLCERPCRRTMECGHKCVRKCSEPCVLCPEKVIKVSSCGHKVTVKCHEEATPSKCSGKCQLTLPCGHPCKAKCKDRCTTMCEVIVRRRELGLCGHVLSTPCHMSGIESSSPELLKYCEQPCGAKLACLHSCGGKCGRCRQGRIHIPCVEPCGNILVCGHKCDIPCRSECQPCDKLCEIKCRHSRCNRKCGVPCVPCKESCEWGCKHRKCRKLCFEQCDIEPCSEPCDKLLRCKHPCVGFCGDPCPPLCRICDNKELTDIFFGAEGEPDARFIYLEDCHHCIESEGLSRWLSQQSEDKSIQVKKCPGCTTPIRKCMRLMNEIKKELEDVVGVKRKIFGERAELKRAQMENLETVQEILEDVANFGSDFNELKTLLQCLWDKGKPVKNKRNQDLSLQEVNAFKKVLEIVRQIVDTLFSIQDRSVSSYRFVKNQVSFLASSLPTRGQISQQELDDIRLELQRLSFMAQICKIDYEKRTTGLVIINPRDYDAVVALLLNVNKFTEELGKKVLAGIKGLKTLSAAEERRMVVAAMSKELGFRQGHWFKCPKGHYYTIGECGGAMQESKCFECGSSIGGSQHRLTSGNTFAPEIDGATEPAWPGTMH